MQILVARLALAVLWACKFKAAEHALDAVVGPADYHPGLVIIIYVAMYSSKHL